MYGTLLGLGCFARMGWLPTDFRAEAPQAGDEHAGASEATHAITPVDRQLAAMQILIDLASRRLAVACHTVRLALRSALLFAQLLVFAVVGVASLRQGCTRCHELFARREERGVGVVYALTVV